MGTLIDSNVFVEVERGKLDLSAWIRRRAGDVLGISAITVSELLHGVHRAPAGRLHEARRAFVEHVIDVVPVHPFDTDAARVHAELGARLAAHGARNGAHDLMIAATALSLGFGVATLNVAEFARVPRLAVSNPAAASP